MADKTPLVLVPGLLCSPAQWAPQMAGLSDIADITIGDHTRHDTMQAIARYIAQQIVLQAPERVARLALLDTACSSMKWRDARARPGSSRNSCRS
jgi:pimeloyl-ACP methyl ester carboxylesterase